MCRAHWQWSHTPEDGHIVHIGLTLAHVTTDTAEQCSGQRSSVQNVLTKNMDLNSIHSFGNIGKNLMVILYR